MLIATFSGGDGGCSHLCNCFVGLQHETKSKPARAYNFPHV